MKTVKSLTAKQCKAKKEYNLKTTLTDKRPGIIPGLFFGPVAALF